MANGGFGGATAGLRIRRAVAEAQVDNREEEREAQRQAILNRMRQTNIEASEQRIRQNREEAQRRRELRERQEAAAQAFAEAEKQRFLQQGMSTEEAEAAAERNMLMITHQIPTPEERELDRRRTKAGIGASEAQTRAANVGTALRGQDLKTQKASIEAMEFLASPEGVALHEGIETDEGERVVSRSSIEKALPDDLTPLAKKSVINTLFASQASGPAMGGGADPENVQTFVDLALEETDGDRQAAITALEQVVASSKDGSERKKAAQAAIRQLKSEE